MSEIAYPATRTSAVVSDVAGLRIPDPFRWLEDETEEVRRWQSEQSELACRVIFADRDRDDVLALVEAHASGPAPVMPRHAAGRWYRADDGPAGRSGAVVVAEQPLGEGVVLLDLDRFAVGGVPAIVSWLRPSPDGRVLAVGVCSDASEHNTIALVDTSTGAVLDGAPPHILHSAWAGGISWLPDSSGFYFLALTGAPEDFHQAMFHHRLGPAGTTTPEAIPLPSGSREYTYVEADGRWAVANHRLGNPIPMAVRDLATGDDWRPFITDLDGTLAGHIMGDHYVAITDVGAPRGRIVAIPLDATDPTDQACWEELLPEGSMVLRTLTVVEDRLYLTAFDRVFASVRVLDRAGAVRESVPLPGRGAIANPSFALTALADTPRSAAFLFAFSTPSQSWGVYRHRPGARMLETLAPSAITLDVDVVEGSATAADGTQIPFHAIRPRDCLPGPMPTLLSAYGAANVPLLPGYQPELATVLDAGAVVVRAYLRGGGEFGRSWWLAGDRERKHVRDDDLVAVAEHLIAAGVTTPDMLALTGRSDAGVMCGVALTRRPDLWRAVLPREPLLDLVGGIRDPYLNFVIRKAWADPDDVDEVARLLTLSPYELVSHGRFPALYIQAGATDPRCRPWQARKFIARMQSAQEGEAPVLLHVYDAAGHGGATPRHVAIAQDAEWLAFLIGELGLPWPARGRISTRP